jgi:hypothetical protein
MMNRIGGILAPRLIVPKSGQAAAAAGADHGSRADICCVVPGGLRRRLGHADECRDAPEKKCRLDHQKPMAETTFR